MGSIVTVQPISQPLSSDVIYTTTFPSSKLSFGCEVSALVARISAVRPRGWERGFHCKCATCGIYYQCYVSAPGRLDKDRNFLGVWAFSFCILQFPLAEAIRFFCRRRHTSITSPIASSALLSSSAMADLVKEGIAKAQPKLAMRFSDLNRVIKKALSPEAPYPYTPGNIEPETTPDLIGDIKSLGFKDYHTLVSCLNATTTGTVDDNNLLLENLIQLLSKLPESSKEGKQLTDGLLTQLWSSLEHPPPTSLSPRFCYRSADGAGNNVHSPSLGAAGTAYARTVPPLTFQPPNQPDPATIFDTLMARGETFTPHPQGISSVLFYLAIIITHDIFQTSPEDHSVNLASSYLDLSPLYGRNEEEQRSIRVFKGGLLKPDCFSSKRILGFPPGVGLLLVMFNRFHNYVVVQLAR